MIYMTVEEIAKEAAIRFKKIRKIKGLSQLELSKQSNVSYGSIKRFETTGEISFHSLIKLCLCLDIENNILNLFKEIPFTSIEEVIRYGE